MKFSLPFTLPTFNKNTTFLIAALVILALIAIYYGSSTISGFEDSAPGKKFCMVYADWCPHCQTVKPSMQQFSDDVAAGKELAGKGVGVQLVNGDPPQGQEPDPILKVLPEVKGFPSFYLLDTKSGAATPYDGPREVSEMIKWISGNV